MLESSTSGILAHSRAGEGLREWNDIVGDVFAGCTVDAADRPFNGELWRCRINELNLVRVQAQPSRVGRWLSGFPKASSGSVLLHLQSEGHSVNCQRGRSSSIEPGGAVLCNPDQRYTIDFLAPYEMFVVELPIASVLAHEPSFDLDRFAGKRVDTMRSQLLLSFLRTAWQQRDCLGSDVDWRDCVSRISLDLAMRAISQAGEHEVVGVSAELRRAVIDHIRQNLANPDLRTSSIARTLHVSTRSVQTVFERLATTASSFILQQRLTRAAEHLIHEPGRQSITQLAYDCGFSDSAYFSRCFKRHFGVAARDYRRNGPGQTALGPE